MIAVVVKERPNDVTGLLRAWSDGNQAAFEELTPIVHEELRRLAGRYMSGERAGHTFRPTDLVSEAYLRLAGGAQPKLTDRVHFFAVAATTMRRILVDHARERSAGKRGGGEQAITFDDGLFAGERPHELVALHEALQALAAFDERAARAVELHYFGGLSHDELAAALDVSVRTVARDLRAAQAWLRKHLQGSA